MIFFNIENGEWLVIPLTCIERFCASRLQPSTLKMIMIVYDLIHTKTQGFLVHSLSIIYYSMLFIRTVWNVHVGCVAAREYLPGRTLEKLKLNITKTKIVVRETKYPLKILINPRIQATCLVHKLVDNVLSIG